MAYIRYKGVAIISNSSDELRIMLDTHECITLKIKHQDDGFIHLASVEASCEIHELHNKDIVWLYLHTGDTFNVSMKEDAIFISLYDVSGKKENVLSIYTNIRVANYGSDKIKNY